MRKKPRWRILARGEPTAGDGDSDSFQEGKKAAARRRKAFLEESQRAGFYLKETAAFYESRERNRGTLLKHVLPALDETSLFLVALAFMLLAVSDPGFIADVSAFGKMDELEFMAPWILTALAGLVWSIVHAFSRKKKSDLAKRCILGFAVFANAASGIASASHMIEHSPAALSVLFSLLNFFTAFTLLYLFFSYGIDEDDVPDDNALPLEILWGAVAMAAVFVFCRYILELYWAFTLSTCIVFASNIHRPLQMALAAVRTRRRRS